MTSVKVFDPAMCCSTGVCGPSVDPELARFASDLEWLSAQGVHVERFNLAQQPEAFVAHPVVTEAMHDRGEGALPLILVNGQTVSAGAYASRDELAGWSGIATAPEPEWSEWVGELVAIGASIAANCEPCLEHHVIRARQAGVSDEMLRRAFAVAREVKDVPARHIAGFAASMAPVPLPVLPTSSEGSCGCGEGGCG